MQGILIDCKCRLFQKYLIICLNPVQKYCLLKNAQTLYINLTFSIFQKRLKKIYVQRKTEG